MLASYLAFKSLKLEGGRWVSPLRHTPWQQCRDGRVVCVVSRREVRRGHGIYAASLEEARCYGSDLFLVAPDTAANDVAWQLGTRGFRATHVRGIRLHDHADGHAWILAAARAGYPQVPGILLDAVKALRAENDPALTDMIRDALRTLFEAGEPIDFFLEGFPADWPYWGERFAAHYAADMGMLPEFPPDWEGWGWRNRYGKTVAHVIASYRSLAGFPPDWPGWAWRDDQDERTVAHVAATYGSLPAFPPEWEGWGWTIPRDEWTVAHAAATKGCLPQFPADWPGWAWGSYWGVTVAHLAARRGLLDGFPPEWEGWSWRTRYGLSVAELRGHPKSQRLPA